MQAKNTDIFWRRETKAENLSMFTGYFSVIIVLMLAQV